MKKDITYVAHEKFVAIVAARPELTTLSQSGFLRVDHPNGRRVYVALTKKVGRVDLYRFDVGTLGKVPHFGLGIKTVQQQLRMDGSEEEVLARFVAVLDVMASLPPLEKPVRAAKEKAPAAPKSDASSQSGEVPSSPEVDPRQKRLDAIRHTRAIAQKMNVPVSPKILAEEADLLLALGAPQAQADAS